MSIQHFVLRPDQHEPALNVIGTQVTVLASNAATQSYGITLQQGEEGAGPPPHSHDWDEAFYILKGEIRFLCDGKVYDCNAGTLVHVPRGTVHALAMEVAVGRCSRSESRDTSCSVHRCVSTLRARSTM